MADSPVKPPLFGSSWCRTAKMTCGSRQSTLFADMVPTTTSLLNVPLTPVTVTGIAIALNALMTGKCEQVKLHKQSLINIFKNENTMQNVHKIQLIMNLLMHQKLYPILNKDRSYIKTATSLISHFIY